MKFEDMNAMQRRLHNAACVLDGDGDEYGFVGMLREAIDDIERMRADAARYRELRRGQHWSVIDGIGDTLRADGLDAAIDSALKTQNARVNRRQADSSPGVRLDDGLCGNGSEVGAGGTAVDIAQAPDIHAELTMAAFHREIAK